MKRNSAENLYLWSAYEPDDTYCAVYLIVIRLSSSISLFWVEKECVLGNNEF